MERTKLLVLFCDGSVRPKNPSFGGFGLYGYTLQPSKRPTRIKHPASNRHHFTSEGILVERDKDPYETLDIIEYIGSIPGDTTSNNLTEIRAFSKALEFAKELEGIKKVLIQTDSNYVVSSYNEHVEKWSLNNWCRADGKTISNSDDWKYIKSLKEELASLGIEVEAMWVKGHADVYGNELADLYSVIGSNYTRIQMEEGGEFVEEVFNSVSSYKDYKDSIDERDIILYFRDLFFSSNRIDDRTFCFLSSSEDEMQLGRRDTASIFSVNYGFIPEVINKTKEIFRSIERPYVVNCCIKLARLNENKHLLRLATLIGVDKLIVKGEFRGTVQLFLVKDTSPYVIEYNKDFPYIVEAGKVFNSANDIVRAESNVINTWTIDITSKVVEDGKLLVNNREKMLDLGEDFEVPFKFVNKLILTLGKDTLPYLALKRLEKDIVSVKAVVELKPGDNFLTLYTLIETTDRVLGSTNITSKFLVHK